MATKGKLSGGSERLKRGEPKTKRAILTLAKFETKVVRNIFNYLNKNTFLKDLLRNGLQFL